MRKYIIGGLFGFLLATAVGAQAETVIDSIIGKTVEGSFPVTVDGKQLSSSAAVIDGTSYLPVRAVGEALNKEVTFDANMGIELKEKGGQSVEDTAQSTNQSPQKETGPTDDVLVDSTRPKDQQISYLKEEIKSIEITLPLLKKTLENGNLNDSAKVKIETGITENEKRLADMKALLEQLQQ